MKSLLFLTLLCTAGADRTVYLERPSHGSSLEPYFNPKSITAVNETVHFVARFEELSYVDLVQPHFPPLNQAFVQFVWAFAESDYTTPCSYNQGYTHDLH